MRRYFGQNATGTLETHGILLQLRQEILTEELSRHLCPKDHFLGGCLGHWDIWNENLIYD